MKIHIRAEGHKFWIALPTCLLLSKAVVKLGLRLARRIEPENGKGKDSIPLSDDQILRICAEIKRVKRRTGRWVLVDVQSADGECVRITI